MLHTLSPFPTRRASSSASASAAPSKGGPFPPSLSAAPRDPLPLARISRDEWVHPFIPPVNPASRMTLALALLASGCVVVGVFGLMCLCFVLAMGWL